MHIYNVFVTNKCMSASPTFQYHIYIYIYPSAGEELLYDSLIHNPPAILTMKMIVNRKLLSYKIQGIIRKGIIDMKYKRNNNVIFMIQVIFLFIKK